MTAPLAVLSIAIYAFFINVLTFVVFGSDKAAAQAGTRRTPETVLLNLSLAGGSPAALVACSYFRHKTRKQPFRSALLTVIGLQILVGAALLWFYMSGP